jgi:hypothetical protein
MVVESSLALHHNMTHVLTILNGSITGIQHAAMVEETTVLHES